MILGKKTLNYIESKFFNYQKIKEAIADTRALQDTKGGVTGGGGHSRVSDPTAASAIRHLSLLHSVNIGIGLWDAKVYDPEKWVKIMDYCFAVYKNTLTGNLVERRYIKNEPPELTMRVMGISSKSTYYSWRDDFATMAAMLAVAEDLLDKERIME